VLIGEDIKKKKKRRERDRKPPDFCRANSFEVVEGSDRGFIVKYCKIVVWGEHGR